MSSATPWLAHYEAGVPATLAPYQVNDTLMASAAPGAFFMHCLPAYRGQEVTHDIFESEASLVFDQAENRLHVQKALLLMLLCVDARIGQV
jgi:ornithine carbamoyltransferase